jgi:hypothetical protein
MLPHRTKKKIASEGVSIPLTFSGKIAPARKKRARRAATNTTTLGFISRNATISILCFRGPTFCSAKTVGLFLSDRLEQMMKKLVRIYYMGLFFLSVRSRR